MLLFSLLTVFTLTYTISMYALKIKIAKLDAELIDLSPQTVQAIELKKEIHQIQEKIAVLQGLEAKQSSWHVLLRCISEQIPRDLWLTSFSAASDQAITIKGQSQDLDSISLFLNQLAQVSYLAEAELIDVETVTVSDQTVYAFELLVRLSERRGN